MQYLKKKNQNQCKNIHNEQNVKVLNKNKTQQSHALPYCSLRQSKHVSKAKRPLDTCFVYFLMAIFFFLEVDTQKNCFDKFASIQAREVKL